MFNLIEECRKHTKKERRHFKVFSTNLVRVILEGTTDEDLTSLVDFTLCKDFKELIKKPEYKEIAYSLQMLLQNWLLIEVYTRSEVDKAI